ncbi:hypothetical protein K438DRAFT_1787215 [Mycena galopus ATCC 62051]|nr:hypothetical protein K438DRAFT_1787215 [Mycena galopus ATCC 62051]
MTTPSSTSPPSPSLTFTPLLSAFIRLRLLRVFGKRGPKEREMKQWRKQKEGTCNGTDDGQKIPTCLTAQKAITRVGCYSRHRTGVSVADKKRRKGTGNTPLSYVVALRVNARRQSHWSREEKARKRKPFETNT